MIGGGAFPFVKKVTIQSNVCKQPPPYVPRALEATSGWPLQRGATVIILNENNNNIKNEKVQQKEK